MAVPRAGVPAYPAERSPCKEKFENTIAEDSVFQVHKKCFLQIHFITKTIPANPFHKQMQHDAMFKLASFMSPKPQALAASTAFRGGRRTLLPYLYSSNSMKRIDARTSG